MDGIFGVGLAEMLIVVLAMFIIGGPTNTAKWAREAGRGVRKMRQAWAQMMADMEKELGPEGKELMDMTREIGQNAKEIRRMSSPTQIVGDASRLLGGALDDIEALDSDKPAASNGKQPEDKNQKYQAWLPPDDN